MLKWLTNLLIKGTVKADAHITTGGTPSDFVKGDGSLDSTEYTVQSDIDASIDAIEIGGRNLLLDSKFIVGDTEATNWERSGYNTVSIVGGVARYTVHSASGSGRLERVIYLEKGVYTVSIKAKTDVVPFNWRMSSLINAQLISEQYQLITDNFSILKWTFEVTDTASVTLRLYYGSDLQISEYIDVEWYKLEKGNKATDWTPAPEDQVTDWDQTNQDSFSFLKNKPSSFPPSAHTHTITEVTGLETALNGKEDSFIKNTAFNKNFGTAAETVAQGNHTHSNLSTGTGLTGITYNGGTARTFAFDTAWGDSRYLQSFTETDPIFQASPAGGITNTDITNWNAKGVQLTADQPNANIHLKDSAGNIISTLNVGFLNNEGTTISFNSTTDEIELRNDDGDLLSSFPASALMTGVGFGLNLTGSTLELTDSANNTIDSVTLTIANIQGLQTALDGKALKTTQITAGTGLTGGGSLSANRTIGLSTTTQSNIAKGVNAHGWGDHSQEGYATESWVNNQGYLTSVGWTDLTGNQSAINLSDFNDDLSYDNYGSWNLKTNGVQRTTVQSGGTLDLIAGNNTSLQYGAGGKVTINSSFNDTTYTAGTGLDLTGTEFSFDTSWGDDRYSLIGHTHTFASLTSKPTTISGYGITDFNSLGDARWALRTRTITGTGSLTGGGNLTSNRTLDLTTTAKSDITKGVTAHGWGDWATGVDKAFVDNLNVDADTLDGQHGSYYLNYNNFTNTPDLTALQEIEYADNFAALPTTGNADKVYITKDNGYMYRWNGSGYSQLTDQTAIWGQVSGTLSNQTDLQTALDGKALKTTEIIAGIGLAGGGDLSSDRTIGLSASTQTKLANGDTAFGWGDHSQEGYLTSVDISNKAEKSTTISAGSGMTGGGTLAGNRIITMGTPSDVTLSTTNSVTSDSHTHEFNPGGTSNQYIDGTGNLQTFPKYAMGVIRVGYLPAHNPLTTTISTTLTSIIRSPYKTFIVGDMQPTAVYRGHTMGIITANERKHVFRVNIGTATKTININKPELGSTPVDFNFKLEYDIEFVSTGVVIGLQLTTYEYNGTAVCSTAIYPNNTLLLDRSIPQTLDIVASSVEGGTITTYKSELLKMNH